MKKLITSISIILCSVFVVNAQDTLINISGNVTSLNGGTPIPNHLVYIQSDSASPLFSYFNTVMTDPNGDYNDSLLIPVNSQLIFNVYTFDCINMMHNTVLVSTTLPLIADFQICDSVINCFADFIAHPAPSDPLKIHFNDHSSLNIDYWFWDFGDGFSSTQKNPTHMYADTGWYLVCLTASTGMPGTSFYCEDTYCDTVYVNWFSPPCIANFDLMNNPIDPFTFSFTNMSGGNVNELMWDFGDGTFSHVDDPVHTYNSPGNYNVCLTVYHIIPGTLDTICSHTQCKQINILPPTFHNIAGQVFANFFPVPVDICDIFLYRIMNNGDILLSDSTLIDTIGVYSFYQIPAGNYYIKIEPEINNPLLGQTLPTYFGDAIYWVDATVIHLDHDFFAADVHLQPYQFFGGGAGKIRGRISYEGGKSGEKGPPARDVEVLLLDMQEIPIKLDYTLNNGTFEFNDLPIGSYLVYPEITGKHTVPAKVTITINTTVVNNIDLIITQNGVFASLDDNLPDNIESISDIYPNPTVDKAYIDLDLSRTSKMEFRIHNHLGQIVNINEHVLQFGENRVSFNTSELVNGMYVLQIVNNDKTAIMRKFLKID